jgi:peptidase E
VEGDRHIVACGGGGFGLEPDWPLLEFILSLARRNSPRVCLVPTAGADNPIHMTAFYRAASKLDCRPSDLPLFEHRGGDPRDQLLEQDVIWVSGGNTANMLAIWRVHGVDRALRDAWEAGVVLAGSSAGMICWFEAGITDSFGRRLAPLRDGLGFLPGSACPHYDGEERRRPVYRQAVEDGFPAGYAADDGVGLHFTGTELREAVSARSGTAYRVERRDEQLVEEEVPARSL